MLKTVPWGVQLGWGKPTKRSGKPMEFPMKSTNSLPTQLRYVKIYFFAEIHFQDKRLLKFTWKPKNALWKMISLLIIGVLRFHFILGANKQ
jgi:hypothetical protein